MTDPRPSETNPSTVPAPDTTPPVQPQENPAPNPAVPQEGEGQESDRSIAGDVEGDDNNDTE